MWHENIKLMNITSLPAWLLMLLVNVFYSHSCKLIAYSCNLADEVGMQGIQASVEIEKKSMCYLCLVF